MTTIGRPRSVFLWLRAETFIHVGSGQQASLIDLPFVREGATGYPYIPGSGMKGALRDAGRMALPVNNNSDPTEEYFGKPDQAGPILASDARLAFLPVRSLSSSYRYVTCTDLMQRLKRDLEFASESIANGIGSLEPEPNSFLGPGSSPLFLEEFPLTRQNDAAVGPLITSLPSETRDLVNKRIAILSNEDFDYFARHGLHVRTRNKLVPETKTVDGGALWSEESLPPDTLMYVMLTPRLPNHGTSLTSFISNILGPSDGYFQVGGNETVGEGWFKILNLPVAPAARTSTDGDDEAPARTTQRQAA